MLPYGIDIKCYQITIHLKSCFNKNYYFYIICNERLYCCFGQQMGKTNFSSEISVSIPPNSCSGVVVIFLHQSMCRGAVICPQGDYHHQCGEGLSLAHTVTIPPSMWRWAVIGPHGDCHHQCGEGLSLAHTVTTTTNVASGCHWPTL